jgi:hypothetical protein
MIDFVTGASPRQLARIAGALYLINIVGGAFPIGFVRAALFTPDLATTAHNIQTHQLLCRLGLAAHLVVTVINVPLALIFYELFKVVNRRLALLTAFSSWSRPQSRPLASSTSSHRWPFWASGGLEPDQEWVRGNGLSSCAWPAIPRAR